MQNKILNMKQIVLTAIVFFTCSIEAQNQQFWEDAKKGYIYGIGHYTNVNLNVHNEMGQTPLMIAVKNGHRAVIDAFSEGIVDIKIQDFEGKTAYDYIQTFSNHPKERMASKEYGALKILEVMQIVRNKAKIVQYSYKNDSNLLQITIKGATCDDFSFPENTQCQALKAHSKHEVFKAIKSKDNALFDQLITTVDDLSMKNKSNYSLLWASIHYHNLYSLERLIELGADMNEFDQNGLKTPVYWAAMINDTELLKVLLKHSANVNSKDLFGSTALSTAMSKCNNFEAIKILLDSGANPYLKDKRGETVFDKKPRFCKKKENIDKMRQLLNRGDKKDLKQQAIELNKKVKIAYANEEKRRKNKEFDKYLSTLSDINGVNSQGFTPLHTAVATKHYYAIKKLIEKGANMHTLDGQYGEWTPFNYTIAMNDIKALKIFLDNGIDINFFHNNKSTVLNDAIRSCNVKIVKLLLDNGANPRLKDGYGGTVTSSLKKCDDVTKKEVLALVNKSIKNGNSSTLQKVEKVEFQISIKKREKEKRRKQRQKEIERYKKAIKEVKYPIFMAIEYKINVDFDKYLHTLDNIELKNSQEATLLYIAVENRNYYAMDKLLKKGAAMNPGSKYRTFTPFTYAVALNNIKAVKIFINYKVNVNYQYKKRSTVLSHAVKGCNVEMIKLLLDSGADPKLANKHNDNAITSLGHCNKKKNKAIENLLKNNVNKFIKFGTGKDDFKGKGKL